jgi:hypothetical protein
MPRWTSETRLKQAERIRALCPWTHSTGPRTEEGKARSARNAWKGGVRAAVRTTIAHYSQLLRQVEASTRTLISSFGQRRVSQPRRTFAPKASRRVLPWLGAAPVLPSNSELDGLATGELMALAGRLLGGGGLPGAGLFSSFC